jgi:hypothetical protein
MQAIYSEARSDLQNDRLLSRHLFETQTIPIYQYDEEDDFLLRAFSEKTCAKMQNYYEEHWKTSEEL